MVKKVFFTAFNLVLALQIVAQQPKILIESGAFTDENGDCFVPFGYNYVGSKFNALLEDNWLTDTAWAVIVSDLQELKTYNGNTARIHLQYNRFMDAVDAPNQVAFERLAELVQVAESQQLYFLITGLCAYRASDQPIWYDALSESERWATQALFWEKVAETVGGSKAVFAYDLINEPVVADTSTWLPGGTFGGFNFVQNLSRTPNGRSFGEIVSAWSSQMIAAIRAKDAITPITIGFIGCGPIKSISEELDFISAHVYPKPDSTATSFCSMRLSDAIDFVQQNQDNKPFVLSEIAPLFSFEDTEVFMDSTCALVNGWFNHYGGIQLEEFSDTSILDALQRLNLLTFKAKYPTLHQCQSRCGLAVACTEGSEPDPNLKASFSFTGNWEDESGEGHLLLNTNCNLGTGQSGAAGTALDFASNSPAYLLAPDIAPLRLRHDHSFTLLTQVYPRLGTYQTLWAYDDKDDLDGDSPSSRDVVRLEINNTGLFDGQVGGDSVFYFVFAYGHDNSTFFTPMERVVSKCFKFDQWYNLAAVYDTGKDSTFLYVNGHLQAKIRHQLVSPWSNSGQYPMIGRNNAFSPILTGFFDGKMDYLKVFDRALTEEEIAACVSAENDTPCTIPTNTNLLDSAPQSLLVSPNPATDHLSITLPTCEYPAQLSLRDVSGRAWLTQVIPGDIQELRVATVNLPEGFYWVQLRDASGRQFVVKVMLSYRP